MLTQKTGIIVGAKTFKTTIKKKDNAYQKQKKRRHFRRRAAIEPIIGHLKSDHRAARNFLKGQIGDSINFIMAAAGFNFKKMMTKLKGNHLWHCFEMQFIGEIMLSFFGKHKNKRNKKPLPFLRLD